MAGDFLENPRRFSRVPARLRVGVVARGDAFEAVTEDLSAGGCLLLSPRPLPVGVQLRITIEDAGAAGRLSVAGRVAWSRDEGRTRAGVAFDARQPGAVDPEAWLRRFLAAQPGLASRVVQAPERLPLDAPLYLLPPPRFILDLTDEEVELLSRIDNGTAPRSLLDGDQGAVRAATRSLFSLFEKRVLTLSLGQSVPASQWRPALSQLAPARPEPAAAGPAAPQGGPPVLQRAPAAAAPRAAPGTAPEPSGAPVPSATSSEPRAAAPAIAATLRAAVGAPAQAPPAAGATAAPVAGPGPGRAGRPQVAQECLDRARAAVAGGDIHTAIALLRRAIQLSPRDGEIAALLGELAFRGRQS